MFLRRFQRRKNGKVHSYFALVESYRTAKGSRHRPDCLQVCIGLVVAEDGLPLAYEVFAGNRHDSTTVRPNVTDLEPAALWKQYIQLTEAEWAFRISKEELRLRPVWHQKQERVLGHILVCFLAYVMWRTLAHWMRQSGLGDASRRPLDELSKTPPHERNVSSSPRINCVACALAVV